MKKELDCIVCPMSCHLCVTLQDEKVVSVSGNRCIRGDVFARSEVTCPMRMVTTTIRIHNAIHPLLPVMTSKTVAKDKIFDIIELCNALEVQAPIHSGAVLVKNVANTGASIIASRSMEMRMVTNESKNTSCCKGF